MYLQFINCKLVSVMFIKGTLKQMICQKLDKINLISNVLHKILNVLALINACLEKTKCFSHLKRNLLTVAKKTPFKKYLKWR